MLTLQKLKYIVTVAQYGSFHKAAQALFVSQPSLSAAVQEVERELNINIFRRTTRGVQLTPTGLEFLPYAHQVLQAATFIETRYSEERAEGGERFSVSSHHSGLSCRALAKLQSDGNRSRSEFHYRECTTLEVINDVADGKSDIGVLCVNMQGLGVLRNQVHRCSLEFNPLAEVTPYVFVRKDHPLTECQKLIFSFDQAELAKYPFVGYYQGPDGLIEFAEEFVDLKYPSRAMRNIFVNDRHSKVDMLLSTDCYTSGPMFFSAPEAELLTAIPIINMKNMALSWIRSPERMMPTAGNKFLEYLRQEL